LKNWYIAGARAASLHRAGLSCFLRQQWVVRAPAATAAAHLAHDFGCSRTAGSVDPVTALTPCSSVTQQRHGRRASGAGPRSNNSPIDIFGLYREVIKEGGYLANERYDSYNRWVGSINFGGRIFPSMRNYTPNNRATSIGARPPRWCRPACRVVRLLWMLVPI